MLPNIYKRPSGRLTIHKPSGYAGRLFVFVEIEMRFYRETQCISVQGQAVGASLQIGSTVWGALPEAWFKPGGRRKGGGSCFVGRLIINAPEDQRGLKVAFELRTPWFTLKRIAKAHEVHDRSSVGWYLRRQMCSGVNI